jgi:hypothetical protein
MTTKIGQAGSAATVADPARPDYEVELIPVAGSQQALDGTLNTLFVAAKRQWTVPWRGLTEAQKNAIITEVARLEHLEWQPPEGGTYTVKAERPRWRRVAPGRYEVDAVLREV